MPTVNPLPEIDVYRLRAGDRDTFESLVRSFYGRVYRLCLRMLGNPSDAEDAAQEAFLRIHRSVTRFKGDAAVSTWIYRIAYNTCLDEMRKQARRPVTHVAHHEVDEAVLELPDEGRSPEELACRADDLSAVKQGLAELPLEFRAVLILREIEDLSYDQIASVLRCPLGTVRSRLARGRQMLAEKLRGRVQIDVSSDMQAASSS